MTSLSLNKKKDDQETKKQLTSNIKKINANGIIELIVVVVVVVVGYFGKMIDLYTLVCCLYLEQVDLILNYFQSYLIYQYLDSLDCLFDY